MNKEQPAAHRVVCYGEVLWDLLPSGAKPGGAPMNVAYHLRQLGEDPAMITRVGLDDRGQQLLQILSEKNVCTDYIQIDTDQPTGIVHAVPTTAGDMTYDIVAGVAWDYISFDAAYTALVEQAEYFVCGSLITRSQTSRNTLFQLLESARHRVLDINLRPPYYNRSLVEELLGKTDLLKMNIAELELITGWFAEYKTTTERMALIQDRFRIPALIVTKGAEGAVINVAGAAYQHPGFKVPVADTVGSGDAFLAGFLARMMQQDTPEATLVFASALGALVASYEGGCPEYSVSEIEALAAGNHLTPTYSSK